MKKITLILFLFTLGLGNSIIYSQGLSMPNQSTVVPEWDLFKQLQANRVYDAALKSESILKQQFAEKGVSYPPRHIYWRAFKLEQIVELWAKDSSSQSYTLIKTYPISKICGDLGPKRKQGDNQIPEGFYKITLFNPWSNFWLSFKLNYPNESDVYFSDKQKPGGDIYVHGDTQTIGCIPLTDSLVKEVYWVSLLNRNTLDSSESIPFHIFPTKLTNENWQFLQQQYWEDKQKLYFWNTLQGVYNYFEDSKTLPPITVDEKGYYKVIYQKRTN